MKGTSVNSWHTITDGDLTPEQIERLDTSLHSTVDLGGGSMTAAGYDDDGHFAGSVTVAKIADHQWVGIIIQPREPDVDGEPDHGFDHIVAVLDRGSVVARTDQDQ